MIIIILLYNINLFDVHLLSTLNGYRYLLNFMLFILNIIIISSVNYVFIFNDSWTTDIHHIINYG